MRCHERSARALLCVRRRYPPKRGGEFLSKAVLGEVDILGMRSKGCIDWAASLSHRAVRASSGRAQTGGVHAAR